MFALFARIPLFARLIVASGLILAGGAAALVVLAELQDEAYYRQGLASRLDEEFASLLPIVANQAVIGDYSVIAQTIEARVRNEYVQSIEWIDPGGAKVVASDRPIVAEAPRWFADLAGIRPLTGRRSVDIGGRSYGDLVVVLTPQPALNRMWARFARGVAIVLVAVAADFLLLLFILRGGLAPLRGLAAGTRRLGEGEYDTRVAPAGPPEVRHSIEAFNKTADTLQRLLKEVGESRRAIEAAAMLVETDLDGRITYATPNFCQLCGYSLEELRGQNHRIMNSGVHPKEHFQALWQTLQEGRIWRGEVCNRAKDGRLFWLHSAITPFFGPDGKPQKYVAIRFDVTALKRTEAALQVAKEAAEAANVAKSNFLATMSHEIRTPMNGIIGMTDLALDTPLSPDQREYLNIVKSSAMGLLDIINDILDFSRIEAGRLDLSLRAFSLPAMLDETLKPLRLSAENKGLAFSLSLAPDLPGVVVGDSTRLRQVLVNLVGNALKFTDVGAIGVSATVLARGEADAIVQFDVRDSGIGIPPDKQAKIFESFVQADATVSRKYGGTGLGLAISAHLVGKMGGNIWVESEHGAGSTFHFSCRFGLADAAEVATGRVRYRGEAPAAWGRTAGTAHDILLVEDNPVNQKVARAMLDKLGHRVTIAGNGQEALEQVERRGARPFDLILMDMQMPHMDGLEATRRLRARGVRTPIVAMTANALAGDRERCLEAGMDDYLAKPINAGRLADLLAQRLGTAAENRASGEQIDR